MITCQRCHQPAEPDTGLCPRCDRAALADARTGLDRLNVGGNWITSPDQLAGDSVPVVTMQPYNCKAGKGAPEKTLLPTEQAAALALQLSAEDEDGWLYVSVCQSVGAEAQTSYIAVFDETGQYVGDL